MNLINKVAFLSGVKLSRPSWTLILFFIFLAVYIVAVLSVIQWGIPGTSIAYPYHMDEWHQFMAVASLSKHFTNNIPGASRGTMFFFLQTGLYLAPFILFHVIHPSLLTHHFTLAGLTELHYLFISLRFFILLLGILTLILIYLICKLQLQTNPLLGVILFAATPLWISWSNYYKYDVGVTFWVVLSIFFLLRYKFHPTSAHFYLAGVIVALTIATKISAIPLSAVYVLAFVLFTKKPFKHFSRLIIGLIILCIVFALIGIPDVLFLGKNWGDYVSVDVVNRHSVLFGMQWYQFLFFENYPIIFGHGLYFLIVVSGVYYATKIRKVFKKTIFRKYSHVILLAGGLLIFGASLVPLEAGANSERILVLLPFVVLLVTFAMKRMLLKYNMFIIPMLCIVIAIQFFESYSWLSVKLSADSKVTSSLWVTQHIKPKTEIALENSPIYQGIPNVLLLDYYRQLSKTDNGIYKYEIFDSNIPKITAPYVVITNAMYEQTSIAPSERKLLAKMRHSGYHVVANFTPDLTLYSYLGDNQNFYFAGLIPTNTITIYAKTH